MCKPDCNQEEVAEDLIHVKKVRMMQTEANEDAWVHNLEKVVPMEEGGDELAPLRRHAQEGAQAEKEVDKRDRKRDRQESQESRSKEAKRQKKEKDQRRKKKKKKKRSSGSGKEASDDKVRMDGTHAKGAAQKESQALFRGTGLDAHERVRNRVARLARRHLKKKVDRSSSNDSSSSSMASNKSGSAGAEEGLFETGSKVRILSEHFPGALTTHAMSQMRSSILVELGHQDRPNSLQPVAVSYCRQHLIRRASGPVQRELLTLTHALDSLLRGKAAMAADVLTQRVKSIEQTLLGSHWSVAQRLEVLPQESPCITALPEAKSAQQEVYNEAKLRWLSTGSEGRPKGAKGGGKTQGKEAGKGQDREGKGKKGGGKSDAAKKKEG